MTTIMSPSSYLSISSNASSMASIMSSVDLTSGLKKVSAPHVRASWERTAGSGVNANSGSWECALPASAVGVYAGPSGSFPAGSDVGC